MDADPIEIPHPNPKIGTLIFAKDGLLVPNANLAQKCSRSAVILHEPPSDLTPLLLTSDITGNPTMRLSAVCGLLCTKKEN